MKVSVVIPTYNRAEELRATLQSLANVAHPGAWEVIVVNNNSTDHTASLLEQATEAYPVPLRALHEQIQGRSAALNTGVLAAHGDVIALTDDDIRFDRNWLVEAVAGVDRFNGEYIGGKILPLWPPTTRPSWSSMESARQRSVLGLVDYGNEAFPFDNRPPVGGNMAMRRDVIERVGLWNNDIGRKAGTLLGQEQREWCIRARRAGLRGVYVPEMLVHHVVPSSRLTRKYFYRWFYWHGVSRALLYSTMGLDMESPERQDLDFARVPHIAGIPRYLYRTTLRSVGSLITKRLRGEVVASFDEELWLCTFAGMLMQRWRDTSH
jgi:glucosyl-dolichyl phosphate glucuronosyltransferase